MYDTIIHGGSICDGLGGQPYDADLAIVAERIATIGNLAGAAAKRTFDAAGKVVSPGFIDMHSHADLALLVDPSAAPKVRQGVTTEMVGMCGLGPAPTYPATAAAWRQSLVGILGDQPGEWAWRTFGAYLDDLQLAQPALNVAALATYGAVRAAVLGLEDRAPDLQEMATMRRLVDEALDDGAFGVSLGLVYLPCFFADAEELVSVYRRVGAKGALMDIHLRSQADGVLEALGEALALAHEADVPLHVSHLCAAGRPNWGKPREMLAAIDAATANGRDVTFDQHPYDAGSTMLSQVLSAWTVVGGAAALVGRLADPAQRDRIKREVRENPPSPDPRMPWQNFVALVGWDNVLITSAASEANRWCIGRSVAEIATARHCDPTDAALDLLIEERGAVAMLLLNLYSPADLAEIMQHQKGMIGSDDVYTGTPHPRLYGTFPRVLGKFAREDGVITLAKAVKRMTSVPARRLGLSDRGVLREGAFADVVVFDPATIRDTATYDNPRQYPTGIHYVFVNGLLTVDAGKQTNARGGSVLRRR